MTQATRNGGNERRDNGPARPSTRPPSGEENSQVRGKLDSLRPTSPPTKLESKKAKLKKVLGEGELGTCLVDVLDAAQEDTEHRWDIHSKNNERRFTELAGQYSADVSAARGSAQEAQEAATRAEQSVTAALEAKGEDPLAVEVEKGGKKVPLGAKETVAHILGELSTLRTAFGTLKTDLTTLQSAKSQETDVTTDESEEDDKSALEQKIASLEGTVKGFMKGIGDYLGAIVEVLETKGVAEPADEGKGTKSEIDKITAELKQEREEAEKEEARGED